ncbi:COG1470 family protein [Ornithinibacillus halophilus]|uniref:NPCBM-associated, NEW3 domain of alpha-galactosidase n=1 Tax=Ornithinibacillus halophilus TaxID=930117 RepID=A0A1M5HYS4_9BACI|nr:NEW3 domain-containing protein [Ornithinibacillus halophilus]SHG21154.1 NPCBM-associated, NEW3 domain of alpha-galactosidase [Ornithinibacillus halophilus]
MVKKVISLLLVLLMGGLTVGTVTSHADVTVYTPLTGLSVTPGEDIEYSVDVINDGNEIEHITFDVEGLPEDWDYSITASGSSVSQLSIRPNREEDILVAVTVPLQVEKGTYEFDLIANGNGDNRDALPIVVNVTEEGTFKTNLTVEQPNMQGHADSTFRYSTTLKNQTAEQQHYSLISQEPQGWNVQFKADSKGVTSVTLEPSEEKTVEVVVTPAENATADSYTIPIQASAGATSSEIELEAVITGEYGVNLTTPDGKLSEDITAGRDRKIELVVENTGTVDLTDIQLNSSTPPRWEATFDNDTIPTLEAGQSTTVTATLTAPDDAIAGDYVTTFRVETAEASSEANFRMSVKTSTTWGFVGVAIILIVIGGLYYIFRKYGRR